MTQHADLEALSAFVDGEAPEWAGHVETCASCRATVDQLRGVSAALRAPVEPPDPRVRDAAIGAALELGGVARHQGAARVPARRRRVSWQLTLAAAAAVIFGVAGLGTLLTQTSSDDGATTVAGPAFESTPTPTAPATAPVPGLGGSGGAGGSSVGGGAASSSANSGAASTAGAADAAGPPVADLGDVPDAATLQARARPAISTSSATSNATGGRSTAPGAPVVTGTRPCEEQARTREPALGRVVYFATASQGSVPAYVLGFSTGPAGSPITLVLLAQNGCGELLRATGP